tara:strand:+ start:3720 stop:4058 length:339 start_codon:yes stop_codon:yes gene_type:complete
MTKPLIKHVQEPWFGYIKSGKKYIEGRLNKGSFQELKEGDIVHWQNNDNVVKTKIISVHHHKDFEKMLKAHSLCNVLPGVKTYKEGVAVYRKFFSSNDVKKYGVLAIKIKRI